MPVESLNLEKRKTIQFIFDLSDSEIKIFSELCSCITDQCVIDIANKINRDRSTIQKVLLKLLDKGIVEKKKITLPEGGYKFIYVQIPKENLRQKALERLENLYLHTKEVINNM